MIKAKKEEATQGEENNQRKIHPVNYLFYAVGAAVGYIVSYLQYS